MEVVTPPASLCRLPTADSRLFPVRPLRALQVASAVRLVTTTAKHAAKEHLAELAAKRTFAQLCFGFLRQLTIAALGRGPVGAGIARLGEKLGQRFALGLALIGECGAERLQRRGIL